MNAEMRAAQWSAVERVFADLGLPLGSPFPVRVGLYARNEYTVQHVRGALAVIGVNVTSVEKRRWPFGRRRLVVAESKPLAIERSAIETWLDRVEAAVTKHDAAVISWAPLVPGA
jgi:hypothetical protein